MSRRLFVLFSILALLAVACTSSDTAEDTADDGGFSPPEAQILPPADSDGPGGDPQPDEQAPAEDPDDGRLVIEHADGQLSTMLPDGTDIVELTDPGTQNRQATWAPDGSRVAWIQVDTAGLTSIALDRFDRSDTRAIEIDEEPTYLYWDPAAARLAYFSNDEAGTDLHVAEPFGEDGPEVRRVDRGQPFFASWGPNGDELLVHASGFRLDQIDLGEATLIVDEFPARFGAPTWVADDTLVFADTEDDEQFLVTTGSSGEGRRPLVTYEGELRFTVSNEGNRIVMQAQPAADDDPIVTASTDPHDPLELDLAFQLDPEPTPEFDDSLDPIDPIEQGIPYIMGSFGGDPFPLSTLPALAFFPSPDGQAVAWFEPVPGGRGTHVLRVDTGAPPGITSQPFTPSEVTLNDYFPSFDQYSQSHDFWSPSSNLFVYAGRELGDTTDGIFVIDLTSGQTTRLADGVVASFTRTPSAAGAASAL